MSIFSAILDKLGLSKQAHATPPASTPKPAETAPKPAPPAAPTMAHPPLPTAVPPKPAEMAPKPAPAAPAMTYPPLPTMAPPNPAELAPKPAPTAAPMTAYPPPPNPAELAPKPVPAAPATAYPPLPTMAPPMPAETAHVAAIPVVDVVAKLEAMAAKRPEKLNWKVSIADLLFLLGMDNSLKARKELAQELGCPANLMGGDYSQMNIWLHKTVLSKIAENGGNIPKELLD